MIFRLLGAQWAATIYVGGVSFALSVLIARQVGPNGFGEYSVALAAGAVLAIFLDGGFRNLLMREYARPSAHLQSTAGYLPARALGNAVLAMLIACLLTVLILQDNLALALATIACFFGVVLAQHVSAMLRGAGRLGVDAGWQIGHRSLSAICIVLVIVAGFHSPWHILAAWALGTLLANILVPFGLRVRPRFAFDNDLYKVALPLLWIDLATAVYFRSDMILLQALGVSDDRIGQYAAGYRVIEAVILIANPVAILFFRKVRRMALADRGIGTEILRAATLAALLGIVCAGGVAVAAEPIIGAAYGDQYHEAANLLVILAWAVVFVLPNAVLTQAALALELERFYAWAATAAALCNVILNILLIGRFGPAAAAWSTIATEAVLMFVLVFTLVGRLKHKRNLGSVVPR